MNNDYKAGRDLLTPEGDVYVLSENSASYYSFWLKDFESKGRTEKEAEFIAHSLLRNRLRYIRNGMPDLPKDEEEAIWKRAFEIHDKKHSDRIGIINPTWGESELEKCNCFELAFQEIRLTNLSKQLPPKDSFDELFTERFE